MGKSLPTKKTKPKKKSSPKGTRLTAAQRLLAAKDLLATAHGATLQELVDRFGCERHAAMRTIASLEEMGEAVRPEREGRRLRFRIENPRGKRAAKLGTANVIAIALAEKMLGFLEGTSLKECFDQVVSVLEHELAPKAFAELGRLRKKIVVTRDAEWVKIDRTEVVDALVTGLSKEERVTVRGPSPEGGEREFDLEPHALVVWRKGLYVHGFSHYHKSARLFGMDKLTDGDWKRGESFEMPEGWDAEARYGAVLGLFDGPEIKVRIEFDAEMARYAMRLQWTPDRQTEEHADGRVILTMTVRGTKDLIHVLLPFREHAVVLEPASLRTEMAEITKRMAANYR